MKYRQLGRTDMNVSILSFGASSLGSVFRATNDEESIQVVRSAIDSGINYIDTAPWYGHGKSETVLGKALADIPRNKYYIATKVGRYQPEIPKMFDFSAERTLRSVDESLARLGLDYVDVIQVHDMEFAPNLDIIVNETLPALDKVRESGKARYVGITGYPLENFKTIIERSKVKIDIVLTYCRYSMNDTALLEYIPYFKEVGVDLSKLAMHFSLDNDDVDTTLVSTASLANLDKNIMAVDDKLNEKEKEALDVVMSRYMTPLKNAHWEGIEVAEYRSQLADPSASQAVLG